MSYIIPTVTKPPEPTALWNGMLTACHLGREHGLFETMSFHDEDSYLDPNTSPRGPNNPNYDAVPSLLDLDSTSTIATSIDATIRRNPTGSVGYTANHRGLEYTTGYSSMFARWWREYRVLAAKALEEEKQYAAGGTKPLGFARRATHGEGAIAAFLMATGDVTSTPINYPTSKSLDIQTIYSTVVKRLEQYLTVLDHDGVMVGDKSAARSIGIGVMPKTGESVSFLSAATTDQLFRSPWRHALRCPRAMEILREQFDARIDCAENIAAGGMLTIAEGEDCLVLPVGGVPPHELAQHIIDTSAQLPDRLTAADYAAARPVVWTDQLYTNGDLLCSLLENSINWTAQGTLCVALAPPVGVNAAGNPVWGTAVVGTGALGSLNYIDDTINNYISGSFDYHSTNVVGDVTSEGVTKGALPNGILYVGDCASASAINWIDILTYLDMALPSEVRQLLEATGRTKLALPKTQEVAISSTDALLGEMVSCGTRDGYLTNVTPSFNVERHARLENDGPVLAATMPSMEGFMVDPVVTAFGNRWNDVDDSQGIPVITHLGQSAEIASVPSTFVGHWEAGRYNGYLPASLGSSLLMGSGTVAEGIALNLQSYPLGTSSLGPAHVVNPLDSIDELVTLQALLADQTDLTALYPLALAANNAGATGWDSFHPTMGFKRGLAMITPQTLIVSDAQSSRSRLDIAAPNVTIGGFESQQFLDDGTGVADSTGDMTPSCTWLWDPTRSQITGQDWRRWAGISFTQVLPHPYVSHPISVATALMTPEEVNTRVDRTGERDIHASTWEEVGSAFSTAGGLDLEEQYTHSHGVNILFRDFSVEHYYGSCAGLTPINGMTCSPSLLSGSVVTSQLGAPAPLGVGSFWTGTITNAMSPEALPPFEVNMSILNGCGRNTTNHVSGLGLNNTGGIAIGMVNAMVMQGLANAHSRTPFRYQGENAVPTGDANDSLCGIMISGAGLLPDEDLANWTNYDPYKWLMAVYNGGEAHMFGPGFQGSLPGTGAYPITVCYGGAVGGLSAYGAGSPLLHHTTLKMPANAWHTVQHPWFTQGSSTGVRRTKARELTIANPWVRQEGENGIVHERYSNEDVSAAQALETLRLKELGKVLKSGLNNDLFLSIQRAN